MTDESSAILDSRLGRGVAYVALVITLWLLGNVVFDLVRQVPDTYPFQHARLLLSILGLGCLFLFLLFRHASVRRWLLVLGWAFVVAGGVLSITTP
jgi:hypothetical protein